MMSQASFSHKSLRTEDTENIFIVYKDIVALNLSFNAINIIPRGISLNIKALNLSHNSISSLDGLDSLTNLLELHLQNNKISRYKLNIISTELITARHSSWGIGLATNLEYFDISCNKIRIIEGKFLE